jgi:hypothetical protein
MYRRPLFHSVQQKQSNILIHVENTVACTVPLAANLAERLQNFGDGFEILEALQFLFFYFMPFLAHAGNLNMSVYIAQV